MDVLHDDPERRSTPSLLLRGVVGGGLHIAQAWIESGHREPIEDVEAAGRLCDLMGRSDQQI